MPAIRVSFEGTIVTDINTAYDLIQGKDIDVSTWTSKQLTLALQVGQVAISLEQALGTAKDTSTLEMYDYSTETESV